MAIKTRLKDSVAQPAKVKATEVRNEPPKPAIAPPPAKHSVKSDSSNRRGRPPSGKIVVTLRLDPDVIAKFKATGGGWQSRINEALKSAKL